MYCAVCLPVCVVHVCVRATRGGRRITGSARAPADLGDVSVWVTTTGRDTGPGPGGGKRRPCSFLPTGIQTMIHQHTIVADG